MQGVLGVRFVVVLFFISLSFALTASADSGADQGPLGTCDYEGTFVCAWKTTGPATAAQCSGNTHNSGYISAELGALGQLQPAATCAFTGYFDATQTLLFCMATSCMADGKTYSTGKYTSYLADLVSQVQTDMATLATAETNCGALCPSGSGCGQANGAYTCKAATCSLMPGWSGVGGCNLLCPLGQTWSGGGCTGNPTGGLLPVSLLIPPVPGHLSDVVGNQVVVPPPTPAPPSSVGPCAGAGAGTYSSETDLGAYFGNINLVCNVDGSSALISTGAGSGAPQGGATQVNLSSKGLETSGMTLYPNGAKAVYYPDGCQVNFDASGKSNYNSGSSCSAADLGAPPAFEGKSLGSSSSSGGSSSSSSSGGSSSSSSSGGSSSSSSSGGSSSSSSSGGSSSSASNNSIPGGNCWFSAGPHTPNLTGNYNFSANCCAGADGTCASTGASGCDYSCGSANACVYVVDDQGQTWFEKYCNSGACSDGICGDGKWDASGAN